MSSNRRKIRVNSVTVNIGCNCRRPRLSDIFRPKPKPKSKSKSDQQQHKLMNVNTTYTNPTIYTNSSSSSWGKGTVYEDEERNSNITFDTTTPCYSEPDSDTSSSKTVRVFGESLAVAKDSDDPYLDFRHSMLQMILEKEIYSRDDLRELLECFLSLNSPYHHEIIVRAFTEIWNGVFSVKPRVRRKAREFQVSHTHTYEGHVSPRRV